MPRGSMPRPPKARSESRPPSDGSGGLLAGRAQRWAGLALLGLAVCVSGLWLLDKAFPPDLSRYQDRSTVVLDAQGGILRAFLASDGIWRLQGDPDTVNRRYLRLLKAYEDKRFDSHWGVDPLAVARASLQWAMSGRIVSGASTLSMQAARLLEPRPRGLVAKLQQMARAVQLEWRFSKPEILRIYLTLAPYGGNLEGVRAASLAYFNKEPKELSLGQAALLVALPQSPERLRPDRFSQAARAGRTKVLTRLLETSAITGQAFEEAMAEPVPDTRRAFPFHSPRLARRLERRHLPGSAIETFIDPAVQRSIEDLAARHGQAFDDPASVAILVVDNETLGVIGYLGGDDFWGRAGQVDLARAIRSPGSALKPFIYGLAFDDLTVHPDTLIEDRPIRFGAYEPRNFDRGYQGTVTIRTALQQSLNVPAVALLDRVGPERFFAGLRQSGAGLMLPANVSRATLPVALGGLGISLQDLTMLFAGLAKGGLVAPLRLTQDVTPAPARRLFGAAAAWYVTDTLRNAPLPDGWGRARNIVRDRQIAFKTGTSYGFRDAWAIGYSGAYTVGAWVGRADGTPRPGHFGRNDAAPVMLQVFSLLPREAHGGWSVPENVLTVSNREDLPPAMRRFTVQERLYQAADGMPPPRIAYPPHGAVVPAGMSEGQGDVILRGQDGTLPLRWIVNGSLLPTNEKDPRLAVWPADGEGFVDVSVVDAEGRSARSMFQVVR